ncbi:MAG: M67 family metallopeptidase [Anaerolineae bacterium]|nr:M67 family metallopeptidase [Anaerolineae bacterium]
MQVVIAKPLQQRIIQQMEQGYPNESGGFLLGTNSGEEIVVLDVIAITNVFAAEEQYHRYAMTPQDWMRLEDEADEKGLTLVGYYHSHPDSPAVPSIYDRDHALPNFTYIITAVMSGKAAEMRVWRLRGDRTQFDEHSLSVQD